jgi:hypothetical protein
MIWIYDIECFSNLFLVVFKNTSSEEFKTFLVHKEIDERKELFAFLKTVKGLVGYNNINYDMQLIEYIHRNPDFTVQGLRSYSDFIIKSDRLDIQEWQFRIPNLDLYRIAGYDNKNRRTSLKWLEFSMDMENIEDLPTEGNDWREMVIEYCKNDVLSTERFYHTLRKEIDLRKKLMKKYNINCLNYSNTKLGSEILLKLYCNKTSRRINDVKTLRSIRDNVALKDIIFPYIKLDKLQPVLDKFNSIVVGSSLKGQLEFSYSNKGFSFDYGVGGIHGSLNNIVVEEDYEYMIIDADVASLYPSIAVQNGLFPEHLGKEFYQVYNEDVVAVRLAEKAKGNDGDKAIVDGFKEVANSTFGNSNNQYSWLYDIKYFLATTVNGQLLLTMLADMLLDIDSLTIIQINTDGITVKIKREDEDKYYAICKAWEDITKLSLEYANYTMMALRDVNNYFCRYVNGKYKCKGAFEFENIPLHKNKSHSIIPRAVFNYFMHNIPVEDTIRNHKNIFDFCAGVRAKQTDNKGKSWYELRWIDKELKTQKLSKTVRYFVSKQGKYLFKCYQDGSYAHVEAPLRLGKITKDWKVTYFNKQYEVDFSNIDYSYYIYHAKQIVILLEGNKNQLKLF